MSSDKNLSTRMSLHVLPKFRLADAELKGLLTVFTRGRGAGGRGPIYRLQFRNTVYLRHFSFFCPVTAANDFMMSRIGAIDGGLVDRFGPIHDTIELAVAATMFNLCTEVSWKKCVDLWHVFHVSFSVSSIITQLQIRDE